MEYPDKWLTYDEPWTVKRVDEAVEVKTKEILTV